jgi:hypothetical protein
MDQNLINLVQAVTNAMIKGVHVADWAPEAHMHNAYHRRVNNECKWITNENMPIIRQFTA